MKKQKRPRQAEPAGVVVNTTPRKFVWWPWAAALAALLLTFEIYGPALAGAFVLDDRYLPFFSPQVQSLPLSMWIRGSRPMLMFSFWLNYATGGIDPYGYHAVNILLHFVNAVLVTFIAARLLRRVDAGKKWAGPSLGIFAGALFLVHPLQTESVAYVASRSEVLSVLFFYAAYCVFLYRRTESITWLRALAVSALFAAAVSTKEHTLTLPLLLLLTDLYWEKGAVRANRRLYALLAGFSLGGAAFVWQTLRGADTAGFRVKDLTPATYFFTQARVVWTYVRLFFLPFGQNADPEVDVSHSLWEHGAILGLAVWALVAFLAWRYRKRFPLASFGVFVFLLLIAPTSSVIPIQDVLQERRLYLPFLGLALVCLEFLRRLPWKQRAMIEAPVLLLLMWGTYQRSGVWADPQALWQDTVAKSPHKVRPRFQLAYALYERNQCAPAAENYEAASRLGPPDYPLLVDWALALDCAGRPDDALAKLRLATGFEPGNAQAFALMGMVYGKQRRDREALEALDQAQDRNPYFVMIYMYRGNVLRNQGKLEDAAMQYRHVIELRRSEEASAQARQALASMGLR